jgi:cleavage and polyadenylation specificity factor subunit 2
VIPANVFCIVRIAPSIDLVLLCHSTLAHIGLYAYAREHFGLTAPCYSTLPTATMGRLSVLEAVNAIRSERRIPGEAGQANEDDKEQTLEADRHLCIATADQVDAAFEHISTLRYLQPTQLDGKCAGLTLTAYSAGHTLGGAVWKLRSPSSGTLLVALDWNHTRERHIDGTALITASLSSAVTPNGPTSSGGGIADAIRRPDVLITSMARASYTNARRKDRDAAMLDVIHNTIRSGHSVLIPVDASSRLLELLVLLDQHWAFAYPHVRFPLCLVSTTGREVVERARTLMEWMTSEWVRANATQAAAEENTETIPPPKRQRNQRNNNNNAAQPASPLDFQYLRIFSSLAAMDEVVSPSDAKVVLAWPPSLTHGPSRKLFARMAGNEKDVVILTQHGQAGSLGRDLFEKWESKQETSAHWGRGKVGSAVPINDSLEVEIHSKVPLQGEELETYLEAQKAANERAAQQKALLARSTRRLEADEDEASDDSGSSGDESEEDEVMMEVEDGPDGEGKKLVSKRGSAIKEEDEGLINSEISFDIYLKGKASRATTFFGTSTERASGRYKTGIRFRMFPVIERKRRIDTFGETLDISKWLSRKRQLEALGGEAVEGDSKASQEEVARRRQQLKEEEAEKKRKEEPPSKFVTDTVPIQIACRIDFIDMEGLGDGRALKTILPQLEPRRVILVESCNASDRESLKRTFSAIRGMTTDVRLPVQGETIEIGEFTFNFTVNLGEDVLGGLRFSNFQDYQVALLKAKINYRAESSIAMLESIDAPSVIAAADSEEENKIAEVKIEEVEDQVMEKATASEPVEMIADEESSKALQSATEQPTTLFIGDLKLSSLKQSLALVSKPSIPSEFIGQGTLICGAGAFGGSNASQQDVVTVRKENEGEIIIEGNVSKNFYSVRDAVYALHAQVTG